MCFFSFILINKNKKLKSEIEDLKLEDKILSKSDSKMDKDIVSIDDISKVSVVSENDNMNKDKLKDKEYVSKESFCDKETRELREDNVVSVRQNKKNREMDKPYSKNVLHDTPKITSPVSLDVEKVSFNAMEFVKREVKKDNGGSKVSANDYLKDISNAIAEEMRPQTIELTDYEKDQEENAIISYKELLNASKASNNVDSEEETLEFIEELKKLRNSLN